MLFFPNGSVPFAFTLLPTGIIDDVAYCAESGEHGTSITKLVFAVANANYVSVRLHSWKCAAGVPSAKVDD